MFIYFYQIDAVIYTFNASLKLYRKDCLLGKVPSVIGLPPVLTPLTVPAEVPGALLNRVFTLMKSFKTRDGYTPAIGGEFKIIGADIEPFNPLIHISNGKATAFTDYILIKYLKGVFIDGVEVFGQRGDNPAFVSLGRINKTSLKDLRRNLVEGEPEIRAYKTRAFIGDELIGDFSPVFYVTWNGPPPIEEE